MASKRRNVRVVVAGAGLAGLTAARCLERAGAEVTVVEARDRVGGRVHTLRDGFVDGQHAEAGADLIESEQTEVLELAEELKLEPVRILRSGWGFYGPTRSGRKKVRRMPDTFERAGKLLEPEIAAYKAAGKRWDSAVAQHIGRESVADWLVRVKADRELAAGVRGLRGFFLADPDDLSLLVLVDLFAQGETPGTSRMYRLRHGNDTLPQALARQLRGRVLMKSVVKKVAQSGKTVRVSVVSGGLLQQLVADYAVLALPASTLQHVTFTPALADEQWQAITSLRYGPATRVVLQFERRFWKKFGRPGGYGTDGPTGAVWDGNEQQSGTPGILILLAGGRASRDVRRLIAETGWPGLVRSLSWLGRPSQLLTATSVVWEKDPWVRGGYAVFSPRFDSVLHDWLARPAGRLVFAGEHTSTRWQGFMNGAVESGRRAAIEVAIMAGLDYAQALQRSVIQR
jgi:monoamine oxidase